MKCEHCGNNLSLEDKVCPYCGKENRLAREHNKDMDKYEADFASVKKEVLTNSRRFNGFTARITIVAVLVAMIACVLVCLANSYSIKDARETRLIRAHYNEHIANIGKLMDEKDHLGLYYYFQVNRLSYSIIMEDYEIAYRAAEQYKNLMEYLYYLHKNDPYTTPEDAMSQIAAISERLLEIKEPRSDYEKNRYYKNEAVVAYANAVTDHCLELISGYFDLDEEEMEQFKTLSRARKQVMLEEGWENVR